MDGPVAYAGGTLGAVKDESNSDNVPIKDGHCNQGQIPSESGTNYTGTCAVTRKLPTWIPSVIATVLIPQMQATICAM